jgi:GNAT superfamily N-acetyltransferase
MEIRRARPEDASAIAEVNILGWRAAARGHVPEERMAWLDDTVAERAAYWAAIPKADGDEHILLIAEDSAKLMGFVHALPSRDPGASADTAEVSTVFVRPEDWAKGIGRALLVAALDELRSQGYAKATLWVLDFNERARHFYERAGFTQDGSLKASDFNGVPLEEVRYELSL